MVALRRNVYANTWTRCASGRVGIALFKPPRGKEVKDG